MFLLGLFALSLSLYLSDHFIIILLHMLVEFYFN